MRRIAIGGITGLAVWLGSALMAEAQIGNQPTGPSAVFPGDQTSLYTSDVTASGSFKVRLKVFLNEVNKHDSVTDVSWLGGTCPFSKLVDMTVPSSWGQTTGDDLRYWTRVWLAVNPLMADVDNWNIEVSAPPGGGSFIMPDRDRMRERTGVDVA